MVETARQQLAFQNRDLTGEGITRIAVCELKCWLERRTKKIREIANQSKILRQKVGNRNHALRRFGEVSPEEDARRLLHEGDETCLGIFYENLLAAFISPDERDLQKRIQATEKYTQRMANVRGCLVDFCDRQSGFAPSHRPRLEG
jgi:hypothetical protein